MANGYQFPYGFQQGNILAQPMPPATSFFQAAQQGKFGVPKPYEPQSSFLAPTMAAIQQKMPQREAFAGVPFPRPTLIPQRQATPQGVPVPQPRPAGMPPSMPPSVPPTGTRTPSIMDRLSAEGLRAAAATGLQLSGYQDRPITTGAGLGAMLESYTAAEQAAAQRQAEAAQRQAEAQRQALADQLDLARFQLDVQKASMPKDPTKPQVETFYDQSTGLPYKAQWNPSTQSWDKVGGVKISDFEQTVVDPETGLVTITRGTGEAPELASKTKGDLESKLLTSDATLNSLISARDMYNETMSQFAPRFNMAVTNIKSGMGFDVSEKDRQEAIKFVEVASRINEVFSDTLNELSGAAVSTQENTRIRTSYGYLGSIANPFSGDSPIEFQAKINGQINALRSINIRAKLLLTGNQKITDDLSYKYPLDYTVDGQTIFFSDFIDDALRSKLAKTEMEAANLWADEISEFRAEKANQ